MENMNSPLSAFHYWIDKNPKRTFLRQPIDRQYKTWTYEEANSEIRKIVSGLQSAGLKKGDHVALLSKNCAHWIMADLAAEGTETKTIMIDATYLGRVAERNSIPS